MSTGRQETDGLMEALRLTASGILDEVLGVKASQAGLLERIVAVEARLQEVLVKIQQNFVKLANDVDVQRTVINKLTGHMTDYTRDLLNLRQTVDQGQEWSRRVENGTLVVMAERLQKLEDRMAEKDQEIAMLRGQVRSSVDCLSTVY
jgi:uncharacterized coiled-coil protein SlyX